MCEHSWCVTPHAATSHPADEDHRSPGTAVRARVRGVGARGVGDDADLEVGIVRRADEDQTWLVIDAGNGIGVEIALDELPRLVRDLRRDTTLRRIADA